MWTSNSNRTSISTAQGQSKRTSAKIAYNWNLDSKVHPNDLQIHPLGVLWAVLSAPWPPFGPPCLPTGCLSLALPAPRAHFEPPCLRLGRPLDYLACPFLVARALWALFVHETLRLCIGIASEGALARILSTSPLRNTAPVHQNRCQERCRSHSEHFGFTKQCACASESMPRALSPAF